MNSKFKRPSNIPFPNVWCRFQLKHPNSDELVHYFIQDLTPNRYEDAIEHLVNYFIADETMCKSRDLSSDLQSIADIRDIIRSAILTYKLAVVVCFREGSDEIVAVNILCVRHTDEMCNWNYYNSSKVRDIETTHYYIFGQFDAFRRYKTRRCLTSFAFSVMPWYRTIGIGRKMLETNKYIARMLGISLISLLLTSNVSHRCAERPGYEKDYEITFAKLACKGATFTYPGVTCSNISVHSFNLLQPI
ncbi:hypothetical protein Bhyg_11059 [Pseudolycoriella hygida]|uniref:N-acetyltransferase domain-containing protein n=1 Tax=Pseudolycoriella hygida TaxID=35572 RepID=A0A9Q0MVK9_9DIPT|nr:hypothetical protein Bhyg_11059 [Pseudolycoriella hygida]